MFADQDDRKNLSQQIYFLDIPRPVHVQEWISQKYMSRGEILDGGKTAKNNCHEINLFSVSLTKGK